jgi:hypothetical protein
MNTLHHITEFVDEQLNATHKHGMKLMRSTHETLRVEVRGMSEYIRMDGRVYRYGLVSTDTQQTIRLATKMMTRAEFRQRFDMDMHDITGLKAHLLTHTLPDVAHTVLPAPVVCVDESTLEWLQCIYSHVTRLNQHWGTRFKTWTHVKVDEHEAILRDLTLHDMRTVQERLSRLTKALLKYTPPQPPHHVDPARVLHLLAGEVKDEHGINEVMFAAMAAHNNPDNVDAMYMLFLRYSAHTLDTNTFSKLPPGKHSTPDLQFIHDYHKHTHQPEWRHPRLPVTTTPTVQAFKQLVQRINLAVQK